MQHYFDPTRKTTSKKHREDLKKIHKIKTTSKKNKKIKTTSKNIKMKTTSKNK
jgi:hypothetical protein